MQRWKEYMASTEADRRRADTILGREQPGPEPQDSEFIGPPWFSEYEPLPHAT